MRPGGGARKRIAHLDRLPSDLRAVERVHRVLGVVLVLEGNEAEGLALRAENFCDGAELSEGLPEGVLIGASEHEARVAVHGPETERGDRGRGFARQLRTRNRAARRVASSRAPDVVVPLPKAGRERFCEIAGGVVAPRRLPLRLPGVHRLSFFPILLSLERLGPSALLFCCRFQCFSLKS